MTLYYTLSSEQLKIELDSAKNTATLSVEGTVIHIMDSYHKLSDGEEIKTKQYGELFIKLINLNEGFTVMQNGIHTPESAGNPKILLQSSIQPLFFSSIAIAGRFVYVIVGLTFLEKAQVLNQIGWKSTAYFSYFFTAIGLTLLSVQLAKKGNWKGPLIGTSLISIDFIFSLGMLIYFSTGVSNVDWVFLGIELIILFLFYLQFRKVNYVRRYTQDIKKI